MTLGFSVSAPRGVIRLILSGRNFPETSHSSRTFCTFWGKNFLAPSPKGSVLSQSARLDSLTSTPAHQRDQSSPSARTLFTLPRTFPAKSRGFIDFQDSLRRQDDVPRGAELVYLLPDYYSTYLQWGDLLLIPAFVVSCIFTLGFIVWGTFMAEDPVKEADDEFVYVIDEEGQKWKQRKMNTGLNLQRNVLEPNAVTYTFWVSISFFPIVCRINNARIPLRIYFHPSLRQYFAVFPRYWKKSRVSVFPASRVIQKHGKFFIRTVEGSHLTLPNKVAKRHFRDDEHSAVFINK